MKKLILIIFVLFFFSCGSNWELPETAEPTVVVEGWIEDGKPATVILTQLVPFQHENSPKEEDFDLTQLPLRWATVKLSDGENEETLVGMRDERYLPPYVYVGSEIKGEPGKTYRLSVKYADVEVWAESTMPEKPLIDKAEAKENASNPDQYSISIAFRDNPQTKDYYKVFTRIKDVDTRWYSSTMNHVDDSVFPDGNASIMVNRAFIHLSNVEDYTPYFNKGESVEVKLTHLHEKEYEFWDSYEDEVTNASNILFPGNTGLKTNIHGGMGIWCAYAVDIVEVSYTE